MNALTERYLAAALRGIAEPQRPDVERELRSSIADAVDDRVAGGEDPAAAEVAVLEGLGDPSSLSAGIAGHRQYLIGPELFWTYRRILTLLLSAVPAIVGVVVAVVTLARDGTAGEAIVAGSGGAVMVAIQIGFWVTVVFAILERVDRAEWGDADLERALGPWHVGRLPELPKLGRVGIGETVGEILTHAFSIAGLVIGQNAAWTVASGATPASIFAPDVRSFWIPILIAILVALAGFQLVLFRSGRWTTSLASIHAVLQVAFGAPVVALALSGSLIDEAFAATIGWPPLADGDGPVMLSIAGGVLLVTAWEIIDGFRRARRAGVG